MSTNACYGRFVFFLIKRNERRALFLGAKQFQYKISTFMVRFSEIRYESCARIADRLKMQDYYINQ